MYYALILVALGLAILWFAPKSLLAELKPYLGPAPIRRKQVRVKTGSADQELAVVLDLLAYAVTAGEPLLPAIVRVSRLCVGELPTLLAGVCSAAQSGLPLDQALDRLVDRGGQVARFARALRIALERGTPLGPVLRAQAADARAHAEQRLLVLAGRKETLMSLPVVFVVLPIIVLISLYPGLRQLALLN